MNIAIIDDDRTAIAALTAALQEYPDVTVSGSATSAKKGLALISQKHPDLIFLDVELPDMSGINFIDNVDESEGGRCRIVIYSSHDKYMLSAFRKKAFDYLLKPIDKSSLETVMQRYYSDSNDEQTSFKPDGDSADIRRRNDNFMLYINSTDFVLARAEDIGLFYYNRERKTWEVAVAGKSDHIILKHSVTSYTILSLNPKFIQVHQSYIINLDYLIEVVDNTCRFYPPFDKVDYVTVGRVFRKKLTDSFLAL